MLIDDFGRSCRLIPTCVAPFVNVFVAFYGFCMFAPDSHLVECNDKHLSETVYTAKTIFVRRDENAGKLTADRGD